MNDGGRVFRKLISAIYGIAVGVAWAMLVSRIGGMDHIATIGQAALYAIVFGIVGWSYEGKTGKAPSMSVAILLPLLPFVMLLGLFGFVLFLLITAAVTPVAAFKGIREERAFRDALKSCLEPAGNGNSRSFGLESDPERGGFHEEVTTTVWDGPEGSHSQEVSGR